MHGRSGSCSPGRTVWSLKLVVERVEAEVALAHKREFWSCDIAGKSISEFEIGTCQIGCDEKRRL